MPTNWRSDRSAVVFLFLVKLKNEHSASIRSYTKKYTLFPGMLSCDLRCMAGRWPVLRLLVSHIWTQACFTDHLILNLAYFTVLL